MEIKTPIFFVESDPENSKRIVAMGRTVIQTLLRIFISTMDNH
jgi:hypothetical protein